MRTPLSSGLAAASLGLLVAGLAFRSWQVVLLALPPVIVLALGSLFPPARPRLVAVRTLSRDRAEAGRDVDVKLVVRNDGPTLDLGAEDAVLPTDARLVVAPTMEDLRRTKLQPRRTHPWFGQVSSRQLGEGTDFWGVREYTAGDEVRRINWKASARLDRLYTNEYEGERSGDVVIVVDARRESFIGTETDNPIEHGVRAALGIAEHVLASKNRVGLIVQREVLDWVPPAFGRKQLYRILDHLT